MLYAEGVTQHSPGSPRSGAPWDVVPQPDPCTSIPRVLYAEGVTQHSPGSPRSGAPWDAAPQPDPCTSIPRGSLRRRRSQHSPGSPRSGAPWARCRNQTRVRRFPGVPRSIRGGGPGCAAARRPWAVLCNAFGVKTMHYFRTCPAISFAIRSLSSAVISEPWFLPGNSSTTASLPRVLSDCCSRRVAPSR